MARAASVDPGAGEDRGALRWRLEGEDLLNGCPDRLLGDDGLHVDDRQVGIGEHRGDVAQRITLIEAVGERGVARHHDADRRQRARVVVVGGDVVVGSATGVVMEGGTDTGGITVRGVVAGVDAVPSTPRAQPETIRNTTMYDPARRTSGGYAFRRRLGEGGWGSPIAPR